MREGWLPTVRIREHSVEGCFDIVGDTMAELATPLKCRGGPGGRKRASPESFFFQREPMACFETFCFFKHATQLPSYSTENSAEDLARGETIGPTSCFLQGNPNFEVPPLVSILTILTHSYHVRCSRNAVLMMMIWWWWWLTMTGYRAYWSQQCHVALELASAIAHCYSIRRLACVFLASWIITVTISQLQESCAGN